MNQKLKTFILWGVLITLILLVIVVVQGKQATKEVKFSDFEQDLNAGHVSKVEIRGRSYTYTRETPSVPETVHTLGVEPDLEFTKTLTNKDISVEYKENEDDGFWQTFLFTWGPMIILLFIFFFFMRQIQAGGGKAMSFGKSRARLMSDHSKRVTFKDVAGMDEAREELEEIIDFLKDPKRFQRLGGRIPKGVLLMGPPGTGKTLLARAIAGEAGVPFFSISGSDFVEMFVGVGASRVRDLFEQGKKNAPCIIFIDEIDAVGRQRGAGVGGGHDEREQTLNQLLVEMDGFETNDGVIIIAATNRPDVLDPVRPQNRGPETGREGARGDLVGAHQEDPHLSGCRPLRHREGNPGILGRGSREPGQRGSPPGRQERQRHLGDGRLRGVQGQGAHGH